MIHLHIIRVRGFCITADQLFGSFTYPAQFDCEDRSLHARYFTRMNRRLIFIDLKDMWSLAVHDDIPMSPFAD